MYVRTRQRSFISSTYFSFRVFLAECGLCLSVSCLGCSFFSCATSMQYLWCILYTSPYSYLLTRICLHNWSMFNFFPTVFLVIFFRIHRPNLSICKLKLVFKYIIYLRRQKQKFNVFLPRIGWDLSDIQYTYYLMIRGSYR